VAAAGAANLALWLALLYSERIPVGDAPASSAHFAATKPLGELQDEGVVELRRRLIYVRDLQALKRVSEYGDAQGEEQQRP
jgi:hypothetical protein